MTFDQLKQNFTLDGLSSQLREDFLANEGYDLDVVETAAQIAHVERHGTAQNQWWNKALKERGMIEPIDHNLCKNLNMHFLWQASAKGHALLMAVQAYRTVTALDDVLGVPYMARYLNGETGIGRAVA